MSVYSSIDIIAAKTILGFLKTELHDWKKNINNNDDLHQRRLEFLKMDPRFPVSSSHSIRERMKIDMNRLNQMSFKDPDEESTLHVYSELFVSTEGIDTMLDDILRRNQDLSIFTKFVSKDIRLRIALNSSKLIFAPTDSVLEQFVKGLYCDRTFLRQTLLYNMSKTHLDVGSKLKKDLIMQNSEIMTIWCFEDVLKIKNSNFIYKCGFPAETLEAGLQSTKLYTGVDMYKLGKGMMIPPSLMQCHYILQPDGTWCSEKDNVDQNRKQCIAKTKKGEQCLNYPCETSNERCHVHSFIVEKKKEGVKEEKVAKTIVQKPRLVPVKEEKVAKEQVQTIDNYLRPTRELQENVRKSVLMNKLQACSAGLPDLKITKVLTKKEKDSASDSIICEGLLHKENVIVKVSFKARGGEHRDNSLEIERRIYAEVLPRILNTMPFLANLACEQFALTKEKLLKTAKSKVIVEKLLKEMKTIDKSRYDLSKANLMITKKARGRKLGDWLLEEETLPTNFVDDVLHQIAYALIQFEDKGLMHNDLHAGNIFVEKLDTPLRLSFDIDGYSRDIKYFVEIYDFDHSSKSATTKDQQVLKNNHLDHGMCTHYGECNYFRKNVDWFRILLSMYEYRNYSLPIIKTLVLDKIMLKGELLVSIGKACTYQGKDQKCKIFSLDDPKLIKSPKDYLEDFYSGISKTIRMR
jgi:hypothetical protein